MVRADHTKQEILRQQLQRQALNFFKNRFPRLFGVFYAYFCIMKSIYLLFVFQLIVLAGKAQCSICTKTAAQIGEEAGKGFNVGILYLAAMPFGIMGYVAYRWWKNEKAS